MDVAHFLVGLGDEVTVIDPSAPWGRRESDSSYGLSPYTFDRVVELKASGKVTFVDERAETITATTVTTKSHTIEVAHPAIDATGFDISKSLAGQLFEFDDEGMPNITENDESTAFSNVFLVGPHVAHGNAIFCFIYKYRQRFAVVAREILKRLGSSKGDEVIAEYKKRGFLLDDLTCCANVCEC